MSFRQPSLPRSNLAAKLLPVVLASGYIPTKIVCNRTPPPRIKASTPWSNPSACEENYRELIFDPSASEPPLSMSSLTPERSEGDPSHRPFLYRSYNGQSDSLSRPLSGPSKSMICGVSTSPNMLRTKITWASSTPTFCPIFVLLRIGQVARRPLNCN
jgi:hypothetical protein